MRQGVFTPIQIIHDENFGFSVKALSCMPRHTLVGNTARFLSGVNNRSLMSKRKANVRTRRFVMDGKMHVCLFTCRRVEAGEILTYDYNAGNEGKDVGQWA